MSPSSFRTSRNVIEQPMGAIVARLLRPWSEPGSYACTPQGRARQARITKALSELGLALPGSVEIRRTRCGKANCRCKADPPQLHGRRVEEFI